MAKLRIIRKNFGGSADYVQIQLPFLFFFKKWYGVERCYGDTFGFCSAYGNPLSRTQAEIIFREIKGKLQFPEMYSVITEEDVQEIK